MNTKKDRQEIANKDLRELNDVGKRIAWCREALGLDKIEVSRDVGMPISSYSGREYGVRTYYHEEYKVLAEYFNSKWKNRFSVQFPFYGGIEIRRIKTLWLLFGEMDE